MTPKRNHFFRCLSIRIVSLYILIGGLWILFSDTLLAYSIQDKHVLTWLQTLKGWLYVFATAVILYFLIENGVKKLLLSKETLEISEERYRLATEGIRDVIWDYDLPRNTYTFSGSVDEFGLKTELGENPYQAWTNTIHPEDRERVINKLDTYLRDQQQDYHDEYRIVVKDTDIKWVLSRGVAIWNQDKIPIRVTGSFTDITERKASEKKIFDLAYKDHTTGLPNRASLNEILISTLKITKQLNEKFAVVFLDLDNFKSINDTLGHAIGDLFLKHIGHSIQKCVDKENTVYRLGGDEFAVLLPRVQAMEEIKKIIQKIMSLFKKSHVIDGNEFYITASFGIVVYPEHGESSHLLLKNGDLAMYHAKKEGKNAYRFYDSAMSVMLLKNLELENNLRKAIQNEEFVVYYQPQIEVLSGKITGLEALVRWNHPTKGFIPPDQFIPLAEETGLIIALDEWVIRTACKQNKKWQDEGHASLSLSVNVSSHHFHRHNLLEMIENILQETEMDAKYLEVEITESIFINNFNETIQLLDQLRKKGVKIAIDDFGTGYSSFSYLKQLPVDILKIDKFFVQHVPQNSVDAEIFKAILSIAQSMRLSVVSEGIETLDQATFLQDQRCEKAQGYFFCRPAPVDEIEKLLDSNRPSIS